MFNEIIKKGNVCGNQSGIGAVGASCGQVTISPYTTQTVNVDIQYTYVLTQDTELEFVVACDGGSNTATVVHSAGDGSGMITVSVPVYFSSSGTFDINIAVRCPSSASSADDTMVCTDAIQVSSEQSAEIYDSAVSL